MLEAVRQIAGTWRADDLLNYEDDFVGGFASGLWSVVNSLTGSQGGVPGAGGVRRLSSGTTLLGSTRLSLPAGAELVRPDRSPIIEGRHRLAPTGTLGALLFEFGYGNATDAAVFQFDGTAGATWRMVTRAGGVATVTTTAAAVAANTFLQLRLVVSPASVAFWAGNVLLTTHTTNLPSSTAYHDLLAASVQTKTTLVGVTADIDYVRVRQTRDP